MNSNLNILGYILLSEKIWKYGNSLKSLLRLVVCSFLSFILFWYCNKYKINFCYVFSSVFFLWFAVLFSSGYVFSIIFFITSLCVLIEKHFMNVYGFPFFKISEQILNVTMNANINEIISYIDLISNFEFFGIFVVILLSVIFVKCKPIFFIKGRHFFFLSLIPFFLFGFPKYYIDEYLSFVSPSESDKEISEQYKKFFWNARINNVNSSPENVIVLIGESHRYDYFSQYWLKNNSINNVLFFTDMISQYGYTLKAMPQILSRKTINDESKYFNESSIIKLYKEAGYDTHFISYIPRVWGGDDSINFIANESENYYLYGVKNSTKLVYKDFIDDMEILPILSNILGNKKRNFIVIKMIGVHYNFQDRYPTDYDLILPSLKNNELPPDFNNKYIFLNTYKNAINYSISVIQKIFKLIENDKRSSLIVFSSDHAINIFDNSQWNIANVKEAFHIPFMIYGNTEFKKNISKEKWENLEKNLNAPLITNDILETLVSLSDISIDCSKNRDLTKDIVINSKKKKRYVVFSDKSIHLYEDL